MLDPDIREADVLVLVCIGGCAGIHVACDYPRDDAGPCSHECGGTRKLGGSGLNSVTVARVEMHVADPEDAITPSPQVPPPTDEEIDTEDIAAENRPQGRDTETVDTTRARVVFSFFFSFFRFFLASGLCLTLGG